MTKFSHKYILLAAVTIWMGCSHSVQILDAQTSHTNASEAVQIGQPMPSVYLTGLHNAPATPFTFADFKGKLVLLDFWATFCGPCVGMFPKLEQLEQQFAGKLQVVSVSEEKDSTVTEFFKRHPEFNVLSARDTGGVLQRLFPHKYIPHYVWIDPHGIVRAITGYEEVTAANVQAMLDGTSLALPVKHDSTIQFDRNRPFLVEGNGGRESNLWYQSVVARYTEGLAGQYGIGSGAYAGRRVYGLNVTIRTLYQMAYYRRSVDSMIPSFPYEQTLLEIPDSSRYIVPKGLNRAGIRQWMQENCYCYELVVPEGKDAELYPTMRQDLERIFGLTSHIEQRPMKVWAVVRTRLVDIGTKGGTPVAQHDLYGIHLRNTPLSDIRWTFYKYLQQGTRRPIVYDIDLTTKVDLDLKAQMTDVQAIRAALSKYGLDIQETTRTMDVLVLREKTPATASIQ